MSLDVVMEDPSQLIAAVDGVMRKNLGRVNRT